MTNALPADTTLADLNAELLDIWRATNSPTTTGRQMQRLYSRAADLRREIAALEAERAQQTAEVHDWLDDGGSFVL